MHFTIVSYTFPPSKEIGGRRWAKFSQHIAKAAHEVTVVCADNSGNEEWYNKEFPGVAVKCLPKHYPDWLSGITKSFIEKLLYLFFTRLLTHFTKQNFFDRGFAWKKCMLNELEDIHQKKKIDVLVVTGAPFSLLYYGAEFKKQHKEVFYVSDFRDPWTWTGGYGLSGFSEKKLMFQKKSQDEVLKFSDMVCSPTQNMVNALNQLYPDYLHKQYLLPHAYDPDKFPTLEKVNQRKGFIYGGTLYAGIESYIKTLIEILNNQPQKQISWDIYSGTHYPLLEADPTNGAIRKHPLIPEEQLFRKITNSAAYLMFFPKSEKDLVSTKFFEIIYTRTPIIYIGEEGEVAKFVRENRIGVHILPENMMRDLPIYLDGNIPTEFGYFDVTNYTFSSVTNLFIKAVRSFKNNQTKN